MGAIRKKSQGDEEERKGTRIKDYEQETDETGRDVRHDREGVSDGN